MPSIDQSIAALAELQGDPELVTITLQVPLHMLDLGKSTVTESAELSEFWGQRVISVTREIDVQAEFYNYPCEIREEDFDAVEQRVIRDWEAGE